MPLERDDPVSPTGNDEKTEVTQVTEVKSDANEEAPSSDGADKEAKPETRSSLLEAVRSAVKKDAEPSTSAPSGGDKEETGDKKSAVSTAKGSGNPAGDGDGDKYDDPKLPFHKHPRWVELRSELKEAKGQLAAHEPAIKRDASIGAFMSKNQLAPDDMVETFRMAALVRNNPTGALKELRQLVADLEDDLGERLPEDLQEALDNGELTEKRAFELAKARATAKRATETVKETETAQQHTQQRQRQAGLLQSMGEMALKWEGTKRAGDPDFDLKYPEVQEIVKARSAIKPPKTVEEAAQYLEDALARVNKLVSATRPKPKAIDTAARRSSSASVIQDAARPKSMRDVVRGALS